MPTVVRSAFSNHWCDDTYQYIYTTELPGTPGLCGKNSAWSSWVYRKKYADARDDDSLP